MKLHPRRTPDDFAHRRTEAAHNRGKRRRQRQAVRKQLARHRSSDGVVPTALVTEVADRVGVTVRTVQRWLRDDAGGDRRREPLAPEYQVLVAKHQRLAPAYREAQAAGYRQSYFTFRRQFAELPEAVRMGLQFGPREATKHQVYTTFDPEPRNALWVLDGMELPNEVMRPDGKAVKPWIVSVFDVGTRTCLASSMCFTSNSEIVAAAIAEAMVGWDGPDGAFVGGVPERLTWDNGREFINDHITTALIELGLSADAGPAYTPWLRPTIERFHATIQDEFARHAPGFTHGQVRRNGKPYSDPLGALWVPERMQAEINLYRDKYNFDRVHSSLGTTPYAAWCASGNPITRANEDEVWWSFMKSSKTPKVTGKGLRFNNAYYVHPDLNAHVGRRMTVRYMLGADTHVGVFDGEHFVCVAKHLDRLTQEEKTAAAAGRREQLGSINSILSEARRDRLASWTEDGVRHTADDPDLALPPAVSVPEQRAGRQETEDLDALLAFPPQADAGAGAHS
jgi:putative transposase